MLTSLYSISKAISHIWLVFFSLVGLLLPSLVQAAPVLIYEMDGGNTQIFTQRRESNWCKKAFPAEVHLSIWPLKKDDDQALKDLSRRVRDEGLRQCETMQMTALDVFVDEQKKAVISFNSKTQEPISVSYYRFVVNNRPTHTQ